mmetsp:Transcript_6810/g.19929  ORF Transcript_6810/g.19929 Transcript_6810/m.19929 type:complete len:116 (-) Transcript_6810:162-509(-)
MTSSQQIDIMDTSSASFVQSQVNSHQVVIFSKSYCPYCQRTKQLLLSSAEFRGVDIVVHELDQMPNGSRVQQQLQTMTGQRTVPNVWINGKFLGGNDDTQAAYRSGDLQKSIACQ